MPALCVPPDPAVAALAVHGGRIFAARAAFPDAPEPWIDLSTGINPHGYSIGSLPADAWQRLPDLEALAGLEAAARAFYRAGPQAGVVAAPGTQALIGLLPRLRPAATVAVLGFGYQEHPAAWRAAGCTVRVVEDVEALAAADVAVVINPNNPDGRTVSPFRLATLAQRMGQRGGLLVVDEAFAEAGEASLLPHVEGPNTLVLRSFGKFFGLAGLRLGFALGDPALCAALRAGLGPWAVSGPALTIGTRALGDARWQADTRHRLIEAAARLDGLLEAAGLAVLGGTPLFRLARHAEAARIFERLGRAGILVRPFGPEPTWLRFG
ncbi:threonine-phosphate decarboxylase CobD, partial [Lichenihabitans sp. Uapishka_5]|uniref:threonine-phosphate decarboxylase CobD n=1 Tax=Lichenihabitans sp. Uapishka_5 TaxID=3037302 RepID=UPI0029E7FAFF